LAKEVELKFNKNIDLRRHFPGWASWPRKRAELIKMGEDMASMEMYERKRLKALIALAHNIEIAHDEGIGPAADKMAIDPEAGTLSVVVEVAPGEYARCTFTVTRMVAEPEPDWGNWQHPYIDDAQQALWNRRTGTVGGR
jgi:hypothetical protein